KHAASVRPEPGSNSPSRPYNNPTHNKQQGRATIKPQQKTNPDNNQHPPTPHNKRREQASAITKKTQPKQARQKRHQQNKTWHTVEFSKIGHTPTPTTKDQCEGDVSYSTLRSAVLPKRGRAVDSRESALRIGHLSVSGPRRARP